MAYLNQNGYPGAMEERGGGPPYAHAVDDWQTQNQYATVTSNIYRIGDNYVGYPDGDHPTDADKVEEWLEDHGYPRAFWSDRKVCNWDSAAGAVRVTAEDFLNIHLMGGFAGYSMKWGRSSVDDSRLIKVHKGHFVTCTGVDLACDGEDQVYDRVQLMDPGSGGWGEEAPYTQSAYRDKWSVLVLTEADYWSPWESVRSWDRYSTSLYMKEYDDGSWNRSLLDGIRWLCPTSISTLPEVDGHPVISSPWSDNSDMKEITFDLPTSVVTSIAEFLPSGYEVVVPAESADGSTELIIKNIPAGFQQSLMTFPEPVTAITTNPQGDLYVATGSVIYRIAPNRVSKIDAYEATILDGVSLAAVDALVFDDAAGQLLAITDGGKYVQRFTDDLALKAIDVLSIGLVGDLSLWMGKDSSHLWLGDENQPVVHEITFDGEFGLTTTSHVLPGISQINGLHRFNDGTLLVSTGGQTVLFEQTDGSEWKELYDEKLTGLPSSGALSVTQSRFVWDESDGVDPEADVHLPADRCLVDFDGDGKVGILEVLGVIDAWGTCSTCAEDVTMDGRVGIADLLAVIDAWGTCN
jgi:hypothetical protein